MYNYFYHLNIILLLTLNSTQEYQSYYHYFFCIFLYKVNFIRCNIRLQETKFFSLELLVLKKKNNEPSFIKKNNEKYTNPYLNFLFINYVV